MSEKPDDLTPRQWKFVQEYIKCGNGAEAARNAGYSEKTDHEQAARLLAKDSVSREVKRLQAKLAQKYEVTHERIIQELASIAFTKPTDLMSWEGDEKVYLKDSDEIAEHHLGAIESVEQRITETGERYIVMRRADKAKALHLLGKHLGLWKEKDAGSSNNQGNQRALLDRVGELLRKSKRSGKRDDPDT
jgi:phage terminase small subunit